jgi:hypothetical protein
MLYDVGVAFENLKYRSPSLHLHWPSVQLSNPDGTVSFGVCGRRYQIMWLKKRESESLDQKHENRKFLKNL